MYIPTQFNEERTEVLHDLIRTHPFTTLVTLSSVGINANHIPLHLIQESGQYGTLQGHVARANPLWRDLVNNVEVLAIFQGPNGYITPSWYPTKQEHGKVVPTWNYVAVHAYGTLRIIDDVSWLRTHLDTSTIHNEAAFSDQWHVSDAPHDYIEKLIGAIVGIEIVITKLTGKWKVSQNQPSINQVGVIKGLQSLGNSEAEKLAVLVDKISHTAR